MAAPLATVSAAAASDFVDQSISGGTVTVYTETGAPADMAAALGQNGQRSLWWCRHLEPLLPEQFQRDWRADRVDPACLSTTPFVNGALNPPITDTDLTGVTIDGVSVGCCCGSISVRAASPSSTTPTASAGVTALSQNGYAAGQYVSVAIDDNGRVVVSYSNGQQVEVAQVVTATFNAANQLKRLDGGIFAATADSGRRRSSTRSGGIVGSSLESSNTDISEEFTKLIVTQQAYAAGTRIVSTADQMLQEALNMVR